MKIFGSCRPQKLYSSQQQPIAAVLAVKVDAVYLIPSTLLSSQVMQSKVTSYQVKLNSLHETAIGSIWMELAITEAREKCVYAKEDAIPLQFPVRQALGLSNFSLREAPQKTSLYRFVGQGCAEEGLAKAAARVRQVFVGCTSQEKAVHKRVARESPFPRKVDGHGLCCFQGWEDAWSPEWARK